MKAILHIGTEKTGTTSIQEVLVLNQKHLENNGVFLSLASGLPNNRSLVGYSMNFDANDDFFCHRKILSQKQKETFDADFINNFDNEITSLPQNCQSVIFSSEHFSSRLKDISEIQRLKALLVKYFDEFNVICYLKPQVELSISHYSTALRIGETRCLENYLQDTLKVDNYYYDYQKIIANWTNVFLEKNTKVQGFNKDLFLNGSLYDDFFSHIGPYIDCKKIEKSINKNTAINSIGQQLLVEYNLLSTRSELTKNNLAKADEVVELVEKVYAGKNTNLDVDSCIELQAKFSKMNTALEQKWGNLGLFDLNLKKENYSPKIVLDQKMKELFLGLVMQKVNKTHDEPERKSLKDYLSQLFR